MVVLCAAAISLCLSAFAGRSARARLDEARLLDMSTVLLAARDHAQTPAFLRTRFPFFQGLRPKATYKKLAAQELKLYDINARRALSVHPFRADGSADPLAFRMLREFMRCRRTGHELDMSSDLILLLLRISEHFDGAELQVISAHRAVDGVVTSERSQHGKGTASDIRIAGVSVDELAEAAHEEGARGVGRYPKSRFVHVDVRETPYAWIDYGDSDEGGRHPSEESGESAGEGEGTAEAPAAQEGALAGAALSSLGAAPASAAAP